MWNMLFSCYFALLKRVFCGSRAAQPKSVLELASSNRDNATAICGRDSDKQPLSDREGCPTLCPLLVIATLDDHGYQWAHAYRGGRMTLSSEHVTPPLMLHVRKDATGLCHMWCARDRRAVLVWGNWPWLNEGENQYFEFLCHRTGSTINGTRSPFNSLFPTVSSVVLYVWAISEMNI